MVRTRPLGTHFPVRRNRDGGEKYRNPIKSMKYIRGKYREGLNILYQLMADIPQPSPEPYEPGDKVRVYLNPTDRDSRFHGVRCEVVDRLFDDLDQETGRELDQFMYRVRRVDGDALPIDFRHSDLVPE